MIAVALTGGIGSGKSAVTSLLAEKGAVIVDLDVVARQVVEPGTAGYEAVVDRFGNGVVASSGALDRPALAAIVFADAAQRSALEAIVHPEVRRVALARLEEESPTDHIVVVDVPLLAEAAEPKAYLEPHIRAVLVVDAPEDTAIDRLVRLRGLTEAEAQARIAAQASRARRLQIADFVILNDGTMAELGAMTDRAWTWMLGLRRAS